MNFTKMQGLGNDFILMEADSFEEAGRFQVYARQLCDRHWGIGADGLILLGPDQEQDIFMRIYNSDGSEAEMCGNGIRCVALYARRNGLVDKDSFRVRTLAGVRCPQILSRDGQDLVQVDMGEPELETSRIPIRDSVGNTGISLSVAGQEFMITAVSMGNPHCIIYRDDLSLVPLADWGPQIENHSIFPEKTNVEFVQVLNEEELEALVWERGAGITLACGTGACAVLVASVLNGKSKRRATVRLPGGELYIEWKEEDGHVYMSGPAVEVFCGIIELK
ncbi:MAG: diaminopimelate epimerase [Syntrophomonadaceae bacterium]|jgi:diaminopimelate epimerase|nr:diaminopimelate epimerase [Syntrophomonadaceae bacterium]